MRSVVAAARSPAGFVSRGDRDRESGVSEADRNVCPIFLRQAGRLPHELLPLLAAGKQAVELAEDGEEGGVVGGSGGGLLAGAAG